MDVLHSIYDWYDGPRAGAADYAGRPYWYRSIYLDTEEWNTDEDRFELTPLTQEAMNWELERASIFNRWDEARKSGLVDWKEGESDSFGCFPEDRLRYKELNEKMTFYLSQNAPTHFVRGSFPEPQRVQWSLLRLLSGAEQGAAGDVRNARA